MSKIFDAYNRLNAYNRLGHSKLYHGNKQFLLDPLAEAKSLRLYRRYRVLHRAEGTLDREPASSTILAGHAVNVFVLVLTGESRR